MCKLALESSLIIVAHSLHSQPWSWPDEEIVEMLQLSSPLAMQQQSGPSASRHPPARQSADLSAFNASGAFESVGKLCALFRSASVAVACWALAKAWTCKHEAAVKALEWHGQHADRHDANRDHAEF